MALSLELFVYCSVCSDWIPLVFWGNSLVKFLNVFHTIYDSYPMSCKSILWLQNSYCSNIEVVVTMSKCFCIYRLKCLKSISGGVWDGNGNLCKHLYNSVRNQVGKCSVSISSIIGISRAQSTQNHDALTFKCSKFVRCMWRFWGKVAVGRLQELLSVKKWNIFCSA